jgi:Raf kinase inhibitor-like YbhB/YbcL family protein
MLVLATTAFGGNARIPERYTCDGANVSPPLHWQGVPAGVKSYALICEDPDAPRGPFYHWAICSIPGSCTGLAENQPPTAAGYMQALNDFGTRGYRGPCPPKGRGVHHYHFKLFALDTERLPLNEGTARCRDVLRSARERALAAAEIIGLYDR